MKGVISGRRSAYRIITAIYVLYFAWFFGVGLMPAEATEYNIIGEINIPAINLSSDVAKLNLENGRLNTPAEIVGSFTRAKNKTLLIGHASSVFREAKNLKLSDKIIYGNKTYEIIQIDYRAKSEISMNKLLASSENDTIIIMTCAGQDLGDGDATHRLIITATRI
ncbi:sortase [Candidatus Saccharibacteria bacterium]|nr:sortase [Candidatus Saccharibacteria bacterium]